MKSKLVTLFSEKIDELFSRELPGISVERHEHIKEIAKNCFMVGYKVGYEVGYDQIGQVKEVITENSIQ